MALASFGNLVTHAAEVPVDGSAEGSRRLRAAQPGDAGKGVRRRLLRGPTGRRSGGAAAARTTALSELVGKRWTGAILFVLMDGPARFSEVTQLVPDLSDRLSEQMKTPRRRESSSAT